MGLLVRAQLGEFFKSGVNNFFGFKDKIWLRGQAVKTSPFHGGNTGSIPVGVIIWRGSQVVRQWSATPVCAGSNPAHASGKVPYAYKGLFRIFVLLQLHNMRNKIS